ncbi:MAG: hypothetical protein J6X19_05585 [Clostridia bacterium]|nr:hypothetical protein [Clostridia bacterium]
MSRKLTTRLLCLLFAAAMLFSVPGLFSGRVFLFAEEGTSANPEPSYIFDFTDYDTYTLRSGGNCSTELTDDGLLCFCDGDDPNVYIGMPDIEGTQMGWMKIRYRGEVNYDARYAELYYIAEGDEYSERDRLRWKWDGISDEWNTQVIQGRALGRKKDVIIDMRFDPLSSGAGASPLIEAGEQLEVAFIAFFATEEEANAFDFDAYKAAQEAARPTKPPESETGEKWQQPAYKAPDVTLKADNVPGTLNIASVPASGDSSAKWRISYSTGGRDFSYEVPQNGFMLNGALGGTDDVGRSIPDSFDKIKPDYVDHVNKKGVAVEMNERAVGVYGENGEHYVGIFYFIWHGTMIDANAPIKNIQTILETYGADAVNNTKVWGNVNDTFWFAEPLYGYYRSEDEWVIRKHMELLINAGVDFLYFDTTNNFLYGSTALKIMEVCHDLNQQGLPAPKVVFYTNTDAKVRVRQAYREIYEDNKFPDTWLMLDGKPLIIAPETANIDDFFTIREPQWPNEEKRENTWPWIDWEWPQTLYGKDGNEAISVSVAQHSGNSEFSSSGLYGYQGNRGRSYNGYEDSHTDDSYKLGTNIQLQFTRAIASGVPYVLVTGWNEWIANRFKAVSEKRPICFIDTFNYEYSRDMEMSRGGYFDNYYMQLAENVAAIRGAAPVILRDDRHQINVTGDFGQWDAVSHYYTDPAGDAAARKAHGCGGYKYENTTGRNDIVRVKVTNDASYLYFMAECADNIVHGTAGDSFMQFYLDVDGADNGWYGYDFIAGFNVKNDYTTTLAKYSGTNGAYGFTDTAELTYKVEGKRLMLAVPMELLGIEHYNRIDLQFKLVDSTSKITTMEQFYEDGDAAPLGRPNYVYQTYIDGVTDGDPVKIVKVAERVNYSKNEPDITPEPKRTNGKNGVNIKLIVLVVVLAVSAGIAVWRIIKTVRRNKAQQAGGQAPEPSGSEGDSK